MSRLVPPDALRARFSSAMSAMFRQEVPLYGALLDLTGEVNTEILAAAGAGAVAEPRLEVERHGAVRLGSEAELAQLSRAFAVLGMQPVGYYDLAAAGLPIHATAFRPVTEDGLARSPFRVFTSVLRPELIGDAALRAEAQQIIAGRRILTPEAEALIGRAEAQGGLTEDAAEAVIAALLPTFQWRREARVSRDVYARLLAAHPLIADIVAFAGPHINHLTPRTLDIDACQDRMRRLGLPAKTTIEGPPRRAAPILLRQTSFTALAEEVRFPDAEGWSAGAHTARFGEIEQRGVALTPRGRELYDRLLQQARGGSLEAAFAAFPDDEAALRREGLAYFRYAAAPEAGATAPAAGDLETLIAAGQVVAKPILYEDFLPVSAAGIFRSNLGEREFGAGAAENAVDRFAAALGAEPLDPFALYRQAEQDSLAAVRRRFGSAVPPLTA